MYHARNPKAITRQAGKLADRPVRPKRQPDSQARRFVHRKPRPVGWLRDRPACIGELLFGEEDATEVIAAVERVELVGRATEVGIHDPEERHRRARPAVIVARSGAPDLVLLPPSADRVPCGVAVDLLTELQGRRNVLLQPRKQRLVGGEDSLLRQFLGVQRHHLVVVQGILDGRGGTGWPPRREQSPQFVAECHGGPMSGRLRLCRYASPR